LSADAWDAQMLFLGQQAIASSHMTGAVTGARANRGPATTSIRTPTIWRNFTGGGEVARYIGRHGTKRVVKAVLIGAVPPTMLQTEKNSSGVPISAFDQGAAGRPRFVLAAGNAGVEHRCLRLHPPAEARAGAARNVHYTCGS
jgi:hypothetical protein